MSSQTTAQAIDWSSGLFSCLDDAGLCVWGMLCTPCLFGENSSKFYGQASEENASCFLPCCMYSTCFFCTCCIGGLYRRDLREKYNLKHEPCGDCTVHLCCSPCAVCQEARELKVRRIGVHTD